MRWPFTRRAVTPSEAGRALAASKKRADRERIHAVAREIREHLGLPPCPEFEPRA